MDDLSKISCLSLEIPRNLPVSTHVLMKSGGVEEIRSGMGVFATFLSSKERRVQFQWECRRPTSSTICVSILMCLPTLFSD